MKKRLNIEPGINITINNNRVGKKPFEVYACKKFDRIQDAADLYATLKPVYENIYIYPVGKVFRVEFRKCYARLDVAREVKKVVLVDLGVDPIE